MTKVVTTKATVNVVMMQPGLRSLINLGLAY
jgi:hypothetical protein